MLGNEGAYGLQQFLRWADMPADGADVGLDDAESEFHGALRSSTYPSVVRVSLGGEADSYTVEDGTVLILRLP